MVVSSGSTSFDSGPGPHTFLITDWLSHTPKEVLAKNLDVPPSTFDKVPKKDLFIFQAGLPGDLKTEQAQAAQGTGTVPKTFDFKASTMKPTKLTRGGEVKIIDSKIFPVTPISAAIVTLKASGLRESHWHPNAMFRTSEYRDLSLAEWMADTPHLLMNQHLDVGMSVLDNIPRDEAVIRPV